MKVRLLISRYLPGYIDPPRFEAYEIDVSKTTTILEALEKIRLEQDSSLLYRRSCHHSSCGTCAIRINGREALACNTSVGKEGTPEFRLEPLAGFDRLGDLVVDIGPLFENLSENWGYVRTIGDQPGDSASDHTELRWRFEDCIECGACVSACPAAGPEHSFRGPAALAALEREMANNPHNAPDLLEQADGPDGAKGCQRALLCSRVCPTGVYPAGGIHKLLQRLDRKER